MTDAAEREMLYDLVRRFAREHIAPHVTAWDEAGEFPRQLYRQAAELGLLGIGYPEELGGTAATHSLRAALWLALCRHGGSGGVLASLLSHNIGLPPVVALGSDVLKQQVVPEVLAGRKIAALAITEPGGGSDVAALRTRARREGDEYVIEGEKTFITSGMRADWITVAVRTGEERGACGISLILVPGDSAGLRRSPLHKMGWQCSDTAHLFFEGVRVPASHLLGVEGEGFRAIMHNFNGERLGIACAALGFAQACYDEALAWAQQRQTFGVTLNQHQVIRHKLVDMQQRLRSTEAWINAVCAGADGGDSGADWVGEVCVLKNHATQTMQFCADTAVQILGGMGFMRGTLSERIYREVKVLTIGGGTEEIMKELAARQWRI
ncbi:acyl-CoA dehydrogenase family protein [Comamonas testosteroni]|jgi:acyl-CoA dehydrogenase|uniref:Acyl-CoA dehydrogenase domain protein n=5 Tax=Comamonas TaxID=283 RepID=B7WZX4_COMTK|nr:MULTISPECIES: acyl-CoA dehydrogenase family protein [Comamonas]AIJ46293.1 acyl-CoA dehydrogenase [Comamonas testosteroni TK102]EED68196.1 acyl-CoA dehydrogenase domain protein [Comamonas testosteroni KF-1]MPS90884.1 acyl-CoA dehydrogenase [Comamonas sp.]TYK73659.1 acyl-CoA dehydrogenase [Comamonas sp. Z3]WQG66301.1 acyl-CoA dehydrogenase family protein [Comamonas testosteroni]